MITFWAHKNVVISIGRVYARSHESLVGRTMRVKLIIPENTKPLMHSAFHYLLSAFLRWLINEPANAIIAINSNASSAHSARFGTASEALSHTEGSTAFQTTSNRSTIRPSPIDTMWSCTFCFRFHAINKFS